MPIALITHNRCGTHMVHKSILDCKLFHEPIETDGYIICNETGNSIFTNDDWSFNYLERRNTYDWFLTATFNYYITNHVLTRSNLYDGEEDRNTHLYNDCVELISSIPSLTLSLLHMKPCVKKLSAHYAFKSAHPSAFDTLYYEDLVRDVKHELLKWHVDYVGGSSSIKLKKPSYDTFFTNIKEMEQPWYKILNAFCDRRNPPIDI